MSHRRTAIVTGSARGIGAAIAHRLARDGYNVVVNYRGSTEAATATVRSIVDGGGQASAVSADITDLAQNRMLFDETIRQTGRLDALVCSAGINVLGRFADLPEAEYDRLFAITKGTYFAMRHALAHMSDGGRIITLSSGLTRNWAVQAAAYAGSKAAIEQFTRSLSKEVGPRGITVNAVLPGVVQTEMTSGYPPARLEAARQQTSFGRLGTPEDIADVVGFLAGDQARWITGQLIVANGGSTP